MPLRKKIVVCLVLMLTLCSLASAPTYAGEPQGGTKGGGAPPAPIPDWVIYLILIGPVF